jgi:hypothetical protein
MTIWDQYAQGTYTAFSWAYTSGGPYRQWTITVTNPDTSTDTYLLVGLDCEVSARPPLPYIVGSPGFRSPPPRAYPFLLPDGNQARYQYRDGMWNLRKDIINRYGGSSISGEDEDQTSGSYDVDTHYWFGAYKRSDGMVIVDASGISYGTLDAGTTYAYPSDFVGSSMPVALSAGGGGAVDLTPVVDALNDIALIDVDYTANNGATIFSMRGKVRTS